MIGTRRTLVAIAAALVCAGAAAQDYPSRPLKLVIPYSPGGITDITGRLIAPPIGDALGQLVVVENRPGGAAIPGMDAVAKAKPDGYTLLMGSTALAANPILFKSIPYVADRDFAGVSRVATVPAVLVVTPSLPAQTVRELIALAKAKPNGLNFGTAGNGSTNHLATEVFMNATGVQAVHVPYKGGGAVMADLTAGQVQFVFAVLPTAYSFIKGGKLRALAVTTQKRSPSLPDVPTMDEAGVPGYNVSEWLGIMVPTGTPAGVIERLNAAIVKALQQPELIERLRTIGAEPITSTPAEQDAYLKGELARWAKLAREANIRPAE